MASKAALLTLFDMLNLAPADVVATDVAEIRRFLAPIVKRLAETGLLSDTIGQVAIRSSAIGALADACLTEDTKTDDDEDITSNRLSSGLMQCLVELCTVKTGDSTAPHPCRR